MNRRERVIKAFNFEETDRVPMDLGGMRSTSVSCFQYRDLSWVHPFLWLIACWPYFIKKYWSRYILVIRVISRYSWTVINLRQRSFEIQQFSSKTNYTRKIAVYKIIMWSHLSILCYFYARKKQKKTTYLFFRFCSLRFLCIRRIRFFFHFALIPCLCAFIFCL